MAPVSEDPGGTRLRLRDDQVVWKRVGDEGVVLDLRSSTYLSLNETGAFLFSLLEGGATEADLSRDLARECQIDEAQASADVKAFLAALSERGLTAADAA
jgi:hypothetical protein